MFPDLARDDVFRLETQRLWLRWPRPQDAALVAQEAADERVARSAPEIPHPYPEGAAAEFILTARKANSEGRCLILMLAPMEQPARAIGCIGLKALSPEAARLRFWLGHSFWGRGLMTEAVRSLVDVAFGLTDLKRFYAAARADSPASGRVLAKSGFLPAGSDVVESCARALALGGDLVRLDRPSWSGLYAGLRTNAQDPLGAESA
jgi:RimJ/RimL family protein N-acetyltransferase